MKPIVVILVLAAQLFINQGFAAAPNHEGRGTFVTDTHMKSDIDDIVNQLFNKEIPSYVSLSAEKQFLARVAALTALGDTHYLKGVIASALDAGVEPEKLYEAIIQCLPYAGVSAAKSAEHQAFEVFSSYGISSLRPAATVTKDNRFDKGLEVQTGIFGDSILKMHESATDETKPILVNLLTGFCFGDVYTRKFLDLKEKELITFSCLAAIGGLDPQVRAHVSGNLSVGNSLKDLTETLTVLVPYVGFPKTLNALNAVMDVSNRS